MEDAFHKICTTYIATLNMLRIQHT